MASVPSRALIKQRDEMDLFGFWGRTYCLVFDLRLLFFLISCIRMNPFVYVFFFFLVCRWNRRPDTQGRAYTYCAYLALSTPLSSCAYIFAQFPYFIF